MRSPPRPRDREEVADQTERAALLTATAHCQHLLALIAAEDAANEPLPPALLFPPGNPPQPTSSSCHSACHRQASRGLRYLPHREEAFGARSRRQRGPEAGAHPRSSPTCYCRRTNRLLWLSPDPKQQTDWSFTDHATPTATLTPPLWSVCVCVCVFGELTGLLPGRPPG